MKGVILAGGMGTRLNPCTLVTNKHLLPVYDRPMIYYPLASLREVGVTEILVVSGPEHSGDFLEILGNGEKFGCRLQYAVQTEAGGIAQALSLAESFADGESVAVILGDNVFADDFSDFARDFSEGARIFLCEVPDAERFGVAELGEGNQVLSIEEKPKNPKTNLAVTGFYLYDNSVFDKIRTLKPSARGELEITDVNNQYIAENKMTAQILTGEWTDAGTFPSLYRASALVKDGVVRTPF